MNSIECFYYIAKRDGFFNRFIQREQDMAALVLQLGITREQAERMFSTTTVRDERLEAMKSLPAGSPLGFPNAGKNHCYIVAVLQCLAVLDLPIEAFKPQFQSSINDVLASYRKQQAARKEGESAAAAQVTTAEIEQFLIQKRVVSQAGAQADVEEALQVILREGAMRTDQITVDGIPDIWVSIKTPENTMTPEFTLTGQTYHLKAVIVFQGRVVNGRQEGAAHYQAYVHQGDKYFCCDGSFVTLCSEEEFMQAAQGKYARGVYQRII